MKKIGVAAALMLCAVGASASNFRGADQVYVPTAGHLQGSSGTFISDVYISNLDDEEVSVSVIYQPLSQSGGAGTEFANQITLGPYERKEFNDFFVSGLGLQSGFGQLIFNGCLKNTSCGPETQNDEGVSPNFRPISVESRIYQIPNGSGANPPTTGQLFSGIPWYNFVSELQASANLDKVFITGLRQTGVAGAAGTFRSNIGLVNASQYSSTTMVVTLYQGGMAASNKKGEYQIQLGPLGNVLKGFGEMFGTTVTGTNYWVTVEQRNSTATGDAPQGCTSGCPAFLAYGSVLDNLSGDATTLEAQYLVELNGDAITVIYPSGAGKNGIRRSIRH